MTISKHFIQHSGITVPVIEGAGGGKGGGKISPNSLFSTDILLLTTAIGEGPVYRINPNGPQDIQIQDSSIDDLINMDGDGKENTDNFSTAIAYGTVTQSPLPFFGDAIISPQGFASAVSLKKGNIANIPSSSVTAQQTSAAAWDSLQFIFSIDQLSKGDSKGNVSPYSVSIIIEVFKRNGITPAAQTRVYTITGKTDKPVKRTIEVPIYEDAKDDAGYVFNIRKYSDDSSDSNILDSISIGGWFEIENTKQAYPRTAIIGYSLKAVNEHTGGIPTFTSMTKGLLVKVPSNYNQPVLSGTYYPGRGGEIDWRELETASSGVYSYQVRGYTLQKPGAGTVLNAVNPQIYVGTWDGSFVYSWTQNPVWIIYDILTNQSYGLGIPAENIDKYKFYQVAQYCDACDPVTGKFMGVDGLADGSYRYKPRDTYIKVRENQLGLPNTTAIKERRFISDISINDQEKSMDLLNKIASTFRGMLLYSGGKITLAIDMPNEYPAMLFNEATIKTGTFQISGSKESDIYTGVDVTYIDPTNHFKRETVRVNTADSNDGTDTSDIENIASLDLIGVTRRSQAVRMAQYQLASSKYQRRSVSFTSSTEALSLSPGDVIAVASQGTGIAYGFGGKISESSALSISNNTKVMLEHFTVPSMTSSIFTNNTYPLSLRVISQDSDYIETYIISDTDFSLINSGESSTGIDTAIVSVLSKFNKATKTFIPVTTTGFTSNVPKAGDLWSLGELQNPVNYYSNKSSKLFKVTNLKREATSEEVTVSAIEYLSSIYEDSDTFINYQPTAYTDIFSPFTPPPSPDFSLYATPRRKLDGTIVVDGVISTNTARNGYGQKFETEYYVSTPTSTSTVSKLLSSSPLTLSASNSSILSNGISTNLVGKNGFSTTIGKIRLLCNAVSYPTGSIKLTIEGLSSCIDVNLNKHIFNTGISQVTIPVIEKTATLAKRNFVGYSSQVTEISRDMTYDIVNNTITIENVTSSGGILSDALLPTPFYISINQNLADINYANNTFYIDGSSYTTVNSGTITPNSVNYIDLEVKPRNANFVRLYVDGVEQTTYQVNTNRNSILSANLVYSAYYDDTIYRVEVDSYNVPAIEIGDSLEVSYANTFVVLNSSYDPASPKYNAALTSNSIFRVELETSPPFSLASYRFINTSTNPLGIINNVSSITNSFTLDYDSSKYPGNFNLANTGIYTVELDSSYSRYFLSDDSKIPELSIGTTSVKARNKNTIGRFSPYVQQSVQVFPIPIQKVLNLQIVESLYIEQTGGVSIRTTVVFDAIHEQDVTDYEISYKLESADALTAFRGLAITEFNTVKVSAVGEDGNGQMRYSIDNINRGASSGANSLTVKVTPLNKSIRGVTTTLTQSIKGKTAPPENVRNFTGGQQNELVTLLWSYATQLVGNTMQLVDLDLQEVEIRKAPGKVAFTLENFLTASPLVTVSAGSVRKSVPIDSYGDFTYLVVTRDTSGNMSTTVVGIQLSLTKAQRSTTVAAYNEDTPSEQYASIPNNNLLEYNFPSYANSINHGLAYSNSTRTDNANGSSSGWSSNGNITDLKATDGAVYITQIRDFGQEVTGSINIFTSATQEVQQTYNDQQFDILNSVADAGGSANVLVDKDFGGIGTLLGYANTSVPNPRYDNTNRTWASGGTSGNIYAIWSHGNFIGDIANANSYALVAGLINANAIALGQTFYANGKATGSNALSNLTTSGASYTLVDLKQFSDISSTYVGTLGIVTSQTLVRTTVSNVYYATNSNINALSFSSTYDGFVPYEVGTKTFRYLQIKFVVNNSNPSNYDFTLDKFRYSIDKEQVVYSNTISYTGSPQTVDYSASKFIERPVLNFAVLSQTNALANPAIVVTTAASNTSVSFKLVASNGTGEYPVDGTATIMMTAIGV